MFEVGRSYRVTTADHEGQSYRSAEVLEVDLPLVKFSRLGNYEIINTASPSFVSAVPDDDQAKRDEEAAAEEFRQSVSIRFVGQMDEDGSDESRNGEQGPSAGY
jgi:hypothetical protein